MPVLNSTPLPNARVVELVDSLASGASARKGVWVRLPPRAPKKHSHPLGGCVFCCSIRGRRTRGSIYGVLAQRALEPVNADEVGLPPRALETLSFVLCSI